MGIWYLVFGVLYHISFDSKFGLMGTKLYQNERKEALYISSSVFCLVALKTIISPFHLRTKWGLVDCGHSFWLGSFQNQNKKGVDTHKLHMFHFCSLHRNVCSCLFQISGFNVVKYIAISQVQNSDDVQMPLLNGGQYSDNYSVLAAVLP